MAERPLCILQVSTSDTRGGAEKIAWNLFQAYKTSGHSSWLGVGHKYSRKADVFTIPSKFIKNPWARGCFTLADSLNPLIGKVSGAKWLRTGIRRIGRPQGLLDWYKGIENFNFPGTWQILNALPRRPDILHCHNLHGSYFDLRALPYLSQQVPTVLTLHDAWLLSGHCAHSFDCERWKTGCGQCPDITIYPAIRKDAAARNWQRKQAIYAKSRFYVATPCRWLMQKVEQSMLAPAIAESRIIPNGVDLSVFHPADKPAIRAALGIPRNTRMLLFAANSIRKNIWKDYQTLRTAISLVTNRLKGQDLLFIALGESAPPERIHQTEIRFIPYQDNPQTIAAYYQAADIYVHPARADTFPNTVLEALACGTPVAATAVGGIPEQVKTAEMASCKLLTEGLKYGLDEATGVLVPPKDAEGLAEAITILLGDETLLKRLGDNAAEDARRRFDLNRQVQDYLGWYSHIKEHL